MSARDGTPVVIGIGNVLLRDDGIGVRVLEAMRSLAGLDPEALPPDTRLLDGGTLGIDLLRHLAGCRSLVLVDAVDFGLAPGAVTVLSGDDLESRPGMADARAGNGVAELVSVARLLDVWPPAAAFVGVQVDEIGVGTELSPCLEGALASAVDAVCRVVGTLDASATAGPGSAHGEGSEQTTGAVA
jgi:hydrogenase maturation protease